VLTNYDVEVVSCPTQTKLPFFDKYTLIIAVLAIILVYVFISKRKHSKKSKNISQRKQHPEKKSTKKKTKKRK